MHVAHGADGRVDGGDGEFLGVIGLDDRLRDGRQGVALGDNLGQAVGDDLEGAHALGDLVGGLAGDVNDVVQEQVQRAEALAGDVPVQLLAHEGQSGHVGEDLLQVACENVGSLEAGGLNGHVVSPVHVYSVRGSPLWGCALQTHLSWSFSPVISSAIHPLVKCFTIR